LFTLVMAFIGAELVYNLASARARSFWRVVFTIPMVIPLTVTLLIWQQVYAGRQGMLNEILVGTGILSRPFSWLGHPDTALPALILIGFPAVAGFGFLIILAALQNLSSEVNDAALIDGCSRLRRVFAIDLPGIRGALALVLILSLNSGMQEFAPMLIMTQGGPITSTMSPAYYLYTQGFNYGKHGYASAIGTVLMMMTLVLSMIILRIRYRGSHDVAI
jgi:ABC-type sugar transport system permease subunit